MGVPTPTFGGIAENFFPESAVLSLYTIGGKMRIDNTAIGEWFFCPRKFYERRIRGIELAKASDSLLFGKRVHELLAHRLDPRLPEGEPIGALEEEAQEMLAAYAAQWGEEPWRVLAVEQLFEWPLGNGHILEGRLDGLVEVAEGAPWPAGLYVLEHKTERRGSRDNDPQAWAERRQVGLYCSGAQAVLGREPDGIILDVLTRGTPGGRVGPSFRRDVLYRSPEQQLDAMAVAHWVAEAAQSCEAADYWPENRDNCNRMGWPCDYVPLHSYATRDRVTVEQLLYKPTENYLHPKGGAPCELEMQSKTPAVAGA